MWETNTSVTFLFIFQVLSFSWDSFIAARIYAVRVYKVCIFLAYPLTSTPPHPHHGPPLSLSSLSFSRSLICLCGFNLSLELITLLPGHPKKRSPEGKPARAVELFMQALIWTSVHTQAHTHTHTHAHTLTQKYAYVEWHSSNKRSPKLSFFPRVGQILHKLDEMKGG